MFDDIVALGLLAWYQYFIHHVCRLVLALSGASGIITRPQKCAVSSVSAICAIACAVNLASCVCKTAFFADAVVGGCVGTSQCARVVAWGQTLTAIAHVAIHAVTAAKFVAATRLAERAVLAAVDAAARVVVRAPALNGERRHVLPVVCVRLPQPGATGAIGTRRTPASVAVGPYPTTESAVQQSSAGPHHPVRVLCGLEEHAD